MSSRSNASASKRILLGLCAFALALSFGAQGADAAKKKKVVVLDFKGPKAAPVQKKVVALLKKAATVITQAKFSATAKKVKGFKANAAGVSKVAKKLKAHAVVSGKVTKKKAKYKLTIQVREGKSGDLVGDDIVVTMKGGKLSKAQEKKIARELKAIIDDLPAPGKAVEEEEPPPEEEPVASEDEEAAPEGEEEEEEVRVAGADEEEKEEAKEEEAPAEEEEEKEEKKKEDDDKEESSVSKSVKLSSAQQADLDARGRAIEVSAGLTFEKRSLEFTHDGDLVNTPQGYDGAMVPGLYVAGEVYPMALVNKNTTGFMRHIGLTLMLDKVLLIKSKPAGMDVDLPTSQTRYGIGMVYRLNFGSTPTSPTLKIGARFNKLTFTIDESAAPAAMVEIPDVSYTYIDPGVAFRYPFTEKIAANAEAHYLVVTKAGQIQQAEQYGTSTVSGFDVDLGGEYKLSSSLLVRAGFRYSAISLTFDGSGTLTNRDADAEQDVASAKDAYLGIYATAGYLF